MNTVDRKARAIATGLLLISGGVAMGALASELTSASVIWRAPERFPETAATLTAEVNQSEAGKSWAQKAYDGGLRQCPAMNPEFFAACQAEMKALAARPAFPAGSYGGPLLVTKVEPTREDPAWADYDRLETPPAPPVRQASYAEEEDSPWPPEPELERTPDNYPAMTEAEPAPQP